MEAPRITSDRPPPDPIPPRPRRTMSHHLPTSAAAALLLLLILAFGPAARPTAWAIALGLLTALGLSVAAFLAGEVFHALAIALRQMHRRPTVALPPPDMLARQALMQRTPRR